MIKPEQLKKVAEYIGYKASYFYWPAYSSKIKYVTVNGKEYNPLQNSDQCLELIEKVILRQAYHIRGGLNDGETHIRDKDYNLISKGPSINEAVTLAAIAYVEGIKESDCE